MCKRLTRQGVWVLLGLTQGQLDVMAQVIDYIKREMTIPEGHVAGIGFKVSSFQHGVDNCYALAPDLRALLGKGPRARRKGRESQFELRLTGLNSEMGLLGVVEQLDEAVEEPELLCLSKEDI